MFEEFSVLSFLNRANRSPQDPDSVFFQNAQLGELYSAVEGRLPSKAKENAIGLLFLYDFLNVFCGYGEQVYLGTWLGVCLNRCNVRVDEDNFYPFLP